MHITMAYRPPPRKKICPYAPCNTREPPFDLSTLTPRRQKDHHQVHRAYLRYSQTSDPAPHLDITAFALSSYNVRGFPSSLPLTLENMLKYYRIIGFPDLAPASKERVKDNTFPPFSPAHANLGDAEEPPKIVDGIALARLDELDRARAVAKPRKKYCHLPGCNAVEMASFSAEKIAGHNLIHEKAAKFYEEAPERSWLYDCGAGYFFDGVVAVWEMTEEGIQCELAEKYERDLAAWKEKEDVKGEAPQAGAGPAKTGVRGGAAKPTRPPRRPSQYDINDATKQKVTDHLWRFGWETHPSYSMLEPSLAGTSLLYSDCWAHKPGRALVVCREGQCADRSPAWNVVEMMLGRVDTPELGLVRSRRPDPKRVLGGVRMDTSRRFKAAEGLVNLLMEEAEKDGAGKI